MSGLETLRAAVHEYGHREFDLGWAYRGDDAAGRKVAEAPRTKQRVAVEAEIDHLELRLEELERYHHRTAALSAALYELTYLAFPDSVDLAAKILKLVEG